VIRCGTYNRVPTPIWRGLFKQLAAAISLRVLFARTAMLVSVSPPRTIYSNQPVGAGQKSSSSINRVAGAGVNVSAVGVVGALAHATRLRQTIAAVKNTLAHLCAVHELCSISIEVFSIEWGVFMRRLITNPSARLADLRIRRKNLTPMSGGDTPGRPLTDIHDYTSMRV